MVLYIGHIICCFEDIWEDGNYYWGMKSEDKNHEINQGKIC